MSALAITIITSVVVVVVAWAIGDKFCQMLLS